MVFLNGNEMPLSSLKYCKHEYELTVLLIDSCTVGVTIDLMHIKSVHIAHGVLLKYNLYVSSWLNKLTVLFFDLLLFGLIMGIILVSFLFT
jgi:hypothetical protein